MTLSNSVVGRRRVDRILDPRYVGSLSSFDSDTLLARRDEAVQEESDVSYVRRLIQGRLDLLKFEQQRRGHGTTVSVDSASANDDESLVKALTSVLVDRSPTSRATDAPGTRAVPLTSPEPEQSVYSRRAAESAVADVRFSDLRSLSDSELSEAIVKFSDLERDVSRTRSLVQQVADTLATEVETRVAAGDIRPELT